MLSNFLFTRSHEPLPSGERPKEIS